MAIFSLIIATIFFYFQSTTTKCSSTPTTTKPQKLMMVTRLIHRDSIFHPQYNPNETLQDHAVRNMKLTASRAASLRTISTGLRPDDFASAFLVEFYIGQPPVRQVASIDSGSNLLWVQCVPCQKCFDQSYPKFDPSRSATYAPQACTSLHCAMLKNKDKCDFQTKQCRYDTGYMDGTGSQGVLATEQFTFDTLQGGTLVVQNLTFGCGFTNHMPNDGISDPIFGIDASPLSIAYQLGDMFSYCIGSITDPTYSYNSLIFGYGLDTEGDATPFTPIDGHFYVTLEAISVGEKRLDIDVDTFQRTSQGGGGTILDSGSTLTMLVDDAYETLKAEIERLADGLLLRFDDYESPWMLCFYGKIGRELVGFPVVTFHFVGGAELAMEAASFFRQESQNRFCMAMDSWQRFGNPDREAQHSIIGVLAQQNYNVVYDLKGYRIFFQRIDCELLMDT